MPLRASRLAARGRALRRLGEEAGELEALRLAARQRRHRLAELHVLEADVDDRLQQRAPPRGRRGTAAPPRLTVRSSTSATRELAHHVAGHAAVDLHVEDLGAEAAAVAVGAAQVDVGEELHLDVLEARAAAGRAAAVAGVEAEHAGAVAALRAPAARRRRACGSRRTRRRSSPGSSAPSCRSGSGRRTPRRRASRRRAARRARPASRSPCRSGAAAPGTARPASACSCPSPRRRSRRPGAAAGTRPSRPSGCGRARPRAIRRGVASLDQALEAHADVLARAEVGAGQRVGAA